MPITTLGECERNLAGRDALATLTAIEAGSVSRIVLPLIVLMQGGGEEGIIARWIALASAEPDARRRADLGGLALVFAEATDHVEVWKKALEGWKVIESKQVMEWQAQARVEGRVQGRAETLLEVVQERLGALPEALAAKIRGTRDINLLQRWLKIATHAPDMDQFLREASLSE